MQDIKAGKVDFRVEKAGIIHASVGKASFDIEKLGENIRALVELLNRMKPSSSKGVYMQTMTVSSTMGPGVDIDVASFKD